VLRSTFKFYKFILSLFPDRHGLEEIRGKRAVLFSYGSGLASSMFAVRVSESTAVDSPVARLVASLADLSQRLESRQRVAPAEFAAAMKVRETTHHLGKCFGQIGLHFGCVLRKYWGPGHGAPGISHLSLNLANF